MIRYRADIIVVILLFITQGCAGGDSGRGLDSRYGHLLKEAGRVKAASPAVPIGQEDTKIKKDALEGLEALDMERAVETALMDNPNLISIRERVKEAAEKYPQVISLDDPRLGIGLYPATIGSNGTDFSYKIDLAQQFPYPGKLGLKGEIAIKEAEAILGDFRSARLELVRMVKTAFLELFYVHRAIEINEEEKRILGEFKTIATSRYAAGEGSLQDPTQAEVELARVEHKSVILKRMLRVAEAKLNTLMGRPAALVLPPPVRFLSLDIKELPDKEALVEQALSHNPDIKSARLKKESAEGTLKLTGLQYYPDLTLMGSYNSAWLTDELRPFIGIGINIPIQFGRLNAQRREAEARLIRVDFELRAALDRVRFKVEEAYQKLKESFHAVKLFGSTLLPAVELNLKAAEIGYREGKNDFLALVTAEKTLFETRLQYERILVDMRIREAELSRAIGEQ